MFVDRVRMDQEIHSYNLVKQQIRSMEADTNDLVKRASREDSVLSMLSTFTKIIKRQEAQIKENCDQFEILKNESIAKITEIEMNQTP